MSLINVDGFDILHWENFILTELSFQRIQDLNLSPCFLHIRSTNESIGLTYIFSTRVRYGHGMGRFGHGSNLSKYVFSVKLI